MKKRNWLAITFVVLLICAIAGGVLAARLFTSNRNMTSASTSIEFTFSGAASGLAPNGNPFNIETISSDDVLGTALDRAGLSSKYTIEQVRSCLDAKGVYPEDMIEQVMSYDSLLNFDANRTNTIGNYIPTLFSISLYDGFDTSISQADLENLLSQIVSSYVETFKKQYGVSYDASITNRLFDLHEYDYIQQLEIIEQELNQLAGYAKDMSALAPSFTLNRTSFNSFAGRVQNVVDTTISQINASVTVNAVSKDNQLLMDQYEYALLELQDQLSTQTQHLADLDAFINSYERNDTVYVGLGTQLTVLNENADSTFSKLMDQRDVLTEKINETTRQIGVFQSRISDLTASTSPSAAQDAAETEEETATVPATVSTSDAELAALIQTRIDAVSATKDELAAEFSTLLSAYTDAQINDSTVVVSGIRYSTPQYLSTAFLATFIKTAGPVCMIGMILCLAFMLLDMRKRSKA